MQTHFSKEKKWLPYVVQELTLDSIRYFRACEMTASTCVWFQVTWKPIFRTACLFCFRILFAFLNVEMNVLPFQLQGGLVRSRRSTTTTGQAFSLFYCCLNDARPPNIVVMYVMTPPEASASFPMSLAFCADERREERCFTRSWNFYRQIHGLLPMVLRRETRNLIKKKIIMARISTDSTFCVPPTAGY